MQISDHDAARQRLLSSGPDDSDEVIAQRLADYLLAGWRPGKDRMTLSIHVRTEPPPGLAGEYRRRKRSLTYKPHTRETATEWIVKAALAGHCVFKGIGGMGTIAEIREHATRERHQIC
jgi:hypothetical protein